MKNINKIAIIFGAVCTLASCAKELTAPDQTISGQYVLDDGTNLASGYISFNDGYMIRYQTNQKLLTFAENAFWHCSKSDFSKSSKVEYRIRNGTLFLNGENKGKISQNGKELTIGNEKYVALECFKSGYYSVITLSPSSSQTDYSGKSISFDYSVKNPLPNIKISVRSDVTWVNHLTFNDSYVSFEVSENTGSSDRKATITISYTEAVDVTYSLTQKWASNTIEITPSSASMVHTGGSASFIFKVPNPRSGATMTASSNVSWVSGISVSSNKVSYTVATNNSGLSRSGKITLKYGTFATTEFTIEQSGHPVTSLQISKTSISMSVGESTTLTATVVPSDAELSWASNKENIASVDKTGKVTALSVGTADISVYSGGISAICTITVINGNNLYLTPSWTESTGLMCTYQGKITISNPSGGTLSIASAPDDKVATAGTIASPSATSTWVMITPVAAGETSITIKSSATSQYSETTKTLQIKVYKATPSFSISPKSIILQPNGSSGQIQITSTSDCTFTASSSNTAVAHVSVSGKIVTVKPYSVGSATIIINCPTTSRYESKSSFECSVNVKSAVDLSSSGTANCYIVNKAGTYEFKATVKGGSSTSVGTIESAEVLWESFGTNQRPFVGDIVSSVSYTDGYVSFSTSSSFNEGNAVIAVKDASNNILWSWHIWISKDFDPNASAQVYNNNACTMMDRNLGASSAEKNDVRNRGLLYQWGRKDPFLGSISRSSGSQISAASTLSWPQSVPSEYWQKGYGTISYAVAHPTTYITSNKNNNDWYYSASTSTDVTRWQTSDKKKSIYDPCPVGWRVPNGGSNGVWSKAFGTSSLWETSSNWDSMNNGMDFGATDKKLGKGIIWYPAFGYIGEKYDLKDNYLYGYYWSCSTDRSKDRPYPYYTYYFYFNFYGLISPSSSNSVNFACALPVRCQKEN